MRNPRPDVQRIRRALASSAAVPDAAFDALLPEGLRPASGTEWTPVAACLDAARWLAPDASARVLDVGSGAGKLCVVGALATGASFTGVEQRAEFVQAARDLSRMLDAPSAEFVHGDALAVEWGGYSSLYFYNPFVAPAETPDLPQADADALQAKLAALRPGTRVVVHFGLGADLPPGFRLVEESYTGHAPMALWVRE